MITTNRMALRAQKSKTQSLVCQFCRQTGSPSPVPRPLLSRTYASNTTSPALSSVHRERFQSRQSSWTHANQISKRFNSSQAEQPTRLQLDEAIAQIAEECSNLCQADAVPANDAVKQLLQRSEKIAETIAQPTKAQPKQEPDEFSSLLDLDEPATAAEKPQPRPKLSRKQLSKQLCQAIHSLLTDEKVFISPEALASYTKIHVLLQQPHHFPEIFHLYANKPIPEEKSSPVRFSKANPNSINSAIPVELANSALDVAIAQRNLSLVLAIIDTTFSTAAFRRAKAYKKAALPLGGLSAAPVACYILATWAGSLQNTMDPSTATGIAFAAGLAYMGGVTSVGLLAITTANDQMERVTWQPGVPLRHRWLREEERAAFDKVALAWGFKDVYLRGEEEGEEWESLREFIGMRGMILDRTDLMEGMQ